MIWGRDDQEWAALIGTTAEFLAEQARLKRTTIYTELNTVLSQRTGFRRFDFSKDSERAAMGALLGEVAKPHLSEVGAMLSALVIYLNENDAGRGFYALATDLGLLPAGATRDARTRFWVEQVNAVHSHFQPRRFSV